MVIRLKFSLKDGLCDPGEKVTRTFDVPGSITLEELCSCLLNSLGFDFDHLFAFYHNDKEYVGGNPFSSGQDRCRVKLFSLNLKKGDKLRFIYDFGDNWDFEVRVLSVSDAPGAPASLIRSEGEVEQYPDYDEFEDEESEWDDDAEWDDESGFGLFDEPDPLMSYEWNYEASDKLFEAAFKYRKTSLWKKIYSDEPFALKYRDGSLAYVSIQGSDDSNIGINVYPNDGGLEAYRRLIGVPITLFDDDIIGKAVSQDCVSLMYDDEDMLRPEEIDSVKKYASQHRISLKGQKAYPHVWRFVPGYVPWHPTDESDEERLYEAILAATHVAGLLKKTDRDSLGFTLLTAEGNAIPLISITDNGYELGKLDVPELKPMTFPKAALPDEKIKKKFAASKARQAVECKIISSAAAIYLSDSGVPVIPRMLFSSNHKSGFTYKPAILEDYENGAAEAMTAWLNSLIDSEFIPRVFMADDDNTYEYLKDMAAELGCRVERHPYLDNVEEAVDALEDNMLDYDEEDFKETYNEMLDMMEYLANAPASEVRSLPGDLKLMLREMGKSGIIPPELHEKIQKKLK